MNSKAGQLTSPNSYKYEFILYMNSYFFAVIMYEFIYLLQCKIKAASACKPQAHAARAKRELQARSASHEGKARACWNPHGRVRTQSTLTGGSTGTAR